MPGSSEVNAINRQKFLAELAKLLSFMYEEDRRYALDMYERMFDIAEGSEQWLIQNLMSPTRQAVIIARSYNAKERKLSVSAEWREEEDQGGETPPFVLAINKIFDDLFPDDEDSEGTDDSQDSLIDRYGTEKKEAKRPRMPKAAVLLDQTQEFESVTASATEGMALEDILAEENQEDDWTDRSAFTVETDIEAEPDPRVQIVDRTEFYDFTEEEQSSGVEEKSVEAASDSETAVQTGTETSEHGNVPQRGTGTSVEEQLAGASQAREQPKKRRSIEELLGFRKGKKRSEGSEQSTAELAEETKQTAEAQSDAVELKEKSETETVGTDASSWGLADQKEQEEASAKTLVKVVPLEDPDVLSEEESASSKAIPVKPAKLSTPEDNETRKKNKDTAESEAAGNSSQEQGTESRESKGLHFDLPEEEPVIRKPEAKKREEEAVPVRKVPKIPAMILFFIVAIPSVPVMLVLLALLVALCVSLSFGTIALGSVLVISAFSGFAVLADILLLLGAAIIALALGLLFLWLAIWLIAEAIVGLLRSIRELYREWCYKEVPAA